jgi:peptidoglycan/LPS O-acetylase OafA/YrhL
MPFIFHPTYRPDIDGLRGIAVLAIVAFHASPHNLRGGFVGVDIFFVISGFLISSIIAKDIANGRFGFAAFYARRIRRIFPALLLVLAVTLVAGWHFLLPGEYKQLGSHAAASAAFIPNLMFWSEAGYFDIASDLKPLLHLWSLGVEEQFYIAWPMIVVLATRCGIRIFRMILLIAIASFSLNVWLVQLDSVSRFFLPTSRAWELLIGCSLANRANPANRHVANAFGVLGLAMIAIACVVLTSDSAFPGWWALLPTMGAALIIWAGHGAWLNSVVLSNRALVFVGLISYPLYLWHWPLLTLPRLIEEDDPSRAARLGAVILAAVLAWLTYLIVERRVRKTASSVMAVALCATSIVIGVWGYSIFQLDGLPFRYPAEIQSLLRSSATPVASNRGGRLVHHCFLQPGENYERYTEDCVEAEPSRFPVLFIWGDSHADAIYPGLVAIRGQFNFRIAEFTASACPPLVGIEIGDRPFCKDINDEILNKIRALRPEIVMLHANWLNPRYDLDHLPTTLAALRRLGVRKVVLVGAVPVWPKPLPKLVVKYYQVWGRVPERLALPASREITQSDARLGEIAKNFGIAFVAPADDLCNQNGCLATMGEPPVITAFDYEHLTQEAAELVARSVAAHF